MINGFYIKLKASQTKIVDEEELDAALSVMGKAKFDQEYECSLLVI